MDFRGFSYFFFRFYEVYSLIRGLTGVQDNFSYFNKSITNRKNLLRQKWAKLLYVHFNIYVL